MFAVEVRHTGARFVREGGSKVGTWHQVGDFCPRGLSPRSEGDRGRFKAQVSCARIAADRDRRPRS
jgi:hypothetical protein